MFILFHLVGLDILYLVRMIVYSLLNVHVSSLHNESSVSRPTLNDWECCYVSENLMKNVCFGECLINFQLKGDSM